MVLCEKTIIPFSFSIMPKCAAYCASPRLQKLPDTSLRLRYSPRRRSLHRRRARPLPPRLRQFLLSEEKLPWRADFEQKSSIAPRRRTNVRREEASEDRKGNIIKLAESHRLSTLNENQTTKMQKRGTMQKHSSSFPFRLCRNTPPPIKKASSSYPPHISPYAHGLRRQRRDGCRHGSNGHGDHSVPPWCRSEHRGPDRRDEGRRY